MSETLITGYYNSKINNHDWVIYMGGEKYFPAYPIHVEEPYNPVNEYLTFEALEDGEIGWWTNPNSDVEVHIFWSKDKENWTEFTQNDNTADYISVSKGENLYCRGVNLDGISGQYALDNDACNGFTQNSGKWNIKGNVMSLIDYNNMTAITEMVGNFYYLFGNEDGYKRGYTINIINANDFILPSIILANSCYAWMFGGCTNLTDAPALPAITLANDCYNSMFRGCTSLTTAPALSATTLASGCYGSMFDGCTSLTEAPVLPAITLASNCYINMFHSCSSLTKAPELPATILANSCYAWMFGGCTNLTDAPALPATTLANDCYNSMFRGCTSLTTAPALSATTLASYCCYAMFYKCTSLTAAPALPATTLAYACYSNMFVGCTSLIEAPELSATTLANYCYNSMFRGCTSLTTAPALSATTLASGCYGSMFDGCTSLNYIKCLAVNGINTNDSTTNWVNGVANSGTFIKNPDISESTWGRDNYGIPSGWNVEDAQ